MVNRWCAAAKAFSSEVDTGSREETRRMKNQRFRSDFNRNGKGSHADICGNLRREPDVKAPRSKSGD
jgi:hypothetical protein